MATLDVSPLASPPVPRSAFGRRLGLAEGFGSGSSPAEDSGLDSWLLAASAHLERRLGLLLTPRACVWRLASWPLESSGALRLPRSPLSGLPEIRLIDAAGAETLWTDWRLDSAASSPRLRPVPGAFWPEILPGGSARVSFTAGLDPLPPDLAEAVLMLAAHWFENREASASGLSETPFGLASLLAPWAGIRL
ncbi:head-tail connector protein [Neomegalonema sp.]|uniref:head-tail connector protein n=1 Tax=Neomegalonema sp. TaxID=2039713 RepID=UPI00261E2B9A|nr:head-tail connector protein [Neomegalonema sp.]MDD2869096.1 head-tail connector protein [Neomegalonema sp.]